MKLHPLAATQSANRFKTLEQDFKEIHGNKYKYNKVIYRNVKTKVTIICKNHGEFLQTPGKHLASRSCPKCARLIRAKKNSINAKKTFKEKAIKKHNGKYKYDKVIYKSNKKEVVIICPDHGSFEIKPTYHLSGYGCKKCSDYKQSLEKRKSKVDFIKDAYKVHGERYCYSEVLYENANTNISIKCSIHGLFQQIPGNHLNGSGCKKCSTLKASQKISAKKKRNYEDTFIEKVTKKHGGKYSYDKVKLSGSTNKIIITCKQHGDFEQVATEHMRGRGCNKCGIVDRNKKRVSLRNDSLISEYRKIHGNKYSYEKAEYTDSRNEITITCKIHGDFKQAAGVHQQGSGCTQCGVELSKTKHTIWNEDEVVKEALKYNSRKEFEAKKPGAYTAALRLKIIDKVCSHMKRGQKGYNPKLPGTLYYLRLLGGTAYKIGITNRTVEERFTAAELKDIEIIKTWKYEYGQEAYDMEQQILQEYKYAAYNGDPILLNGNTEMFNHDILQLDLQKAV